MKINYSGKKFDVDVKRLGFLGRFIGLMFKFNKSKTENLLFEFNKDVRMEIHSFFVFFSFLAIWLDSKNNVVDYRFVEPFRFFVKSKKKFRKLIEIPVNSKNSEILEFFRREKRKV